MWALTDVAQYEEFYAQRGIKMQDYVLNTMKASRVDFISSPEINFLKGLKSKVNQGTTKLIFQFLDDKNVEPSTKQPYSIIAKDLVTVKSFASGIMVPKQYIWPVKPDGYLGPPTTLVADAHQLGLEVYASGFNNDVFTSYNYSYDPVAEYLQFLNEGPSVDGFVTDFPPTASEAIGMMTNLQASFSQIADPLPNITAKRSPYGILSTSLDLTNLLFLQHALHKRAPSCRTKVTMIIF